MTPGDAAREVADRVGDFYTEDERLLVAKDMLHRSWVLFGELLDKAPIYEIRAFGGPALRLVTVAPPCGTSCPDGIACPLADDWPGVH